MFEKVTTPSPVVVSIPTPALSLARKRETCTPETRSPEGLCTMRFRSAAKRTLLLKRKKMKMPKRFNSPPHAKGVGEGSRRSPGSRVAMRRSPQRLRPSRLHSGPSPKKLAYSCAAARDLHPLPSSAPAAERANLSGRSGKNNRVQDCASGEVLTLSAAADRVNPGVKKTASQRKRSRVRGRPACRRTPLPTLHHRHREVRRSCAPRECRPGNTAWGSPSRPRF